MRIEKRAVVTALALGAAAVSAGIAITLADSPATLEELARSAVSSGGDAQTAIADLRARGSEGLEAFLRVHEATLERGRPENRAPVASALDALCQQYDCASSRLFWHTDFDAALEQARKSGKPILSLRLLGKLSEELSCANSRFFRRLLYADPSVASYMRQNFVLHWESVRPVPEVTIDFGDGRVLKRTLTGNSIHYVLDAEGRVVDGLPGLYSATPFLAALGRAVPVARRSSALDGPERLALLTAYHRDQLTTSLQLIGSRPERLNVALVESQYPTALEASEVALTKMVTEVPMLRMLNRLERSVAKDTEFNERVLHRQIHEWLAREAEPDLETFNERVYAELFLTPSSDPWLGLVSTDVYDAITEHGVIRGGARHE
jgi:hypothetical protein